MNEPLTFAGLLRGLASRQPDSSFLISSDSGRELTCGRLWRHCQGLGRQFKTLGLGAGDKVSVYMPNGELTAVLLLGIMTNGLVANPINLMCQPAQLRHILEHSDTRLIFAGREQAGALKAALREVKRDVRLVVCDPAGDEIPSFALDPAAGGTMTEPQPGDPALLMYTSGTTGVPKGVLHSHDSLIYNGRCISEAHHLARGDRVLGSLPLYHINGLVVTLVAPLVHEGSVVMTPRFSVASFWTDASRFRCTWINVVPTIISYLLNEGSDAATPDLSRLRFCRSASSALAPEHHRAFEKRFGIGIIETMGLTETAAPAFSNPYEQDDRRIGSIGKPSGTRAMVVGADGKPVASWEKGEIILTGHNVMLGYYKDPERTRDVFTDDGWLRTGDIGHQDEQGYFYVTGRAKELIIKGGENIAPREIDEVVIKHPSVLDAAAVGVPHPDYGQDIAVYLVLRDNAVFDSDALRRHCLSELGKYKTPSKYVVVDELPRGPSGKVQRLKLLELDA